jgi:hypothetical protein
MTTDVTMLRDTIQLTPGRVKAAATQMKSLLVGKEKKLFSTSLDEAVRLAEEAVQLANRQKKGTTQLYGDEAREEDQAADALVALIFQTLTLVAKAYGEKDPAGSAANQLLKSLYPRGLSAIVHAPYAEEVILIEELLKSAKTPENTEAVSKVSGLSLHLDSLAERVETYRQALQTSAPTGVSYREVRQAQSKADVAMLEVVAAILIEYRGEEAESSARKQALLRPYTQQLDSLRARYRRRVPVGDTETEEDAPVVEPLSEPADDILPDEPSASL